MMMMGKDKSWGGEGWKWEGEGGREEEARCGAL